LTAAAHGIPVLVATGDCDAAQHLAVGPNGGCFPGQITTKRATAAWDDSPWVTAVGGTVPNLSATGKRLGPDPVWNLAPSRSPNGEGAGFSAVYARPGYQNSVAAITKSSRRSVPDITMNASNGTSEAAPLFAGVLALATQLNHGKNVGPINSVLYHVLGPAGLTDGIADVTSGSNTLAIVGKVFVRGFTAARENAAVRARAAAALAKLEHQVELSESHVPPGGTTLMTAQGFLPRHPVRLFIDGRKVVKLQADEHGSVRYPIRPSELGLRHGRHVIRLASML